MVKVCYFKLIPSEAGMLWTALMASRPRVPEVLGEDSP